MMNELQIFNTEDLTPLKTIEKNLKTYFGIVYFLEYGDSLKIGRSIKPYNRMMSLKREATKYNGTKLGRVAISPPHTNIAENEKVFHKYFEDKRINDTELFNISFDDLLQAYSDISVLYKDESEEIERQSELFCEGMKSLLASVHNSYTR